MTPRQQRGDSSFFLMLESMVAPDFHCTGEKWISGFRTKAIMDTWRLHGDTKALVSSCVLEDAWNLQRSWIKMTFFGVIFLQYCFINRWLNTFIMYVGYRFTHSMRWDHNKLSVSSLPICSPTQWFHTVVPHMQPWTFCTFCLHFFQAELRQDESAARLLNTSTFASLPTNGLAFVTAVFPLQRAAFQVAAPAVWYYL